MEMGGSQLRSVEGAWLDSHAREGLLLIQLPGLSQFTDLELFNDGHM